MQHAQESSPDPHWIKTPMHQFALEKIVEA